MDWNKCGRLFCAPVGGSLNRGIAAAAADAVKKTIVVAGGTYHEAISLVDGVSLFGQYQSATWMRDPANSTVIDGVASLQLEPAT